MDLATRGDLIVVARDHDARSGPGTNRVEGLDEGLDRDGAPGVPKVPEERDAGVPRLRLAMHRLEDVDADARGAAVEVEVGEDDPSADARVIGAERVIREDVHGRAGCGGDGWVRGGIGIGSGPASRGFFPARHQGGASSLAGASDGGLVAGAALTMIGLPRPPSHPWKPRAPPAGRWADGADGTRGRRRVPPMAPTVRWRLRP